MSTVPTKTLYRLEVRPLTLSPYKKVTIWNSKTGLWDVFRLKRGRWFTAHRRTVDERPVFAGGPGTSRLNSMVWAAAQAKAFRKRGFAANIVAVEVPQFPHLRGDLDADHDVLVALDKTARDLGVKIDVESGGRTYNEQRFLHDLYLSGHGNLAARPGTSRHETGRAVDAYINGVPLADHADGRGRAAAKRRGFRFPVSGEPWHAEKPE